MKQRTSGIIYLILGLVLPYIIIQINFHLFPALTFFIWLFLSFILFYIGIFKLMRKKITSDILLLIISLIITSALMFISFFIYGVLIIMQIGSGYNMSWGDIK